MMDPFNIGLYAIEAGLVGVVIYAMAVLPALFKPMIWSMVEDSKTQLDWSAEHFAIIYSRTAPAIV